MPQTWAQLFAARVEFSFSRPARARLKKAKPILPSVHAERYRVVTESVIKGPWRNIITPYLVDIMDAADYPSVLTTILCKCVQSGGSEAAHNYIAYAVDRKPGPVMYVYPNRDAGRKQLKKRILPLFKASPRLRRYLTGSLNDENNLEIKLKHTSISVA